MKRFSHAVVLSLFTLLLLGSTSAFAGNGHGQNNQGQNNNGNNGNNGNKGQGNNGGGLIGFIEGIINDIFGGGNNNQGSNQGSNDGGSWSNGGGGTAPIDGGLSLLLVAGIGLGIKKMTSRRNDA